MARDVGLSLGYHNHNWEFFRLTDDPSRTAFDVLIKETDRRYVHFELDLFWSWRGAQDPVDILQRLNGRVLQYHVKDMNQAGSFEDPGRASSTSSGSSKPRRWTSTSSSATTPAHRPGLPPKPSIRRGWATTSWRT
jgi:sugar phosphate isomerase/epimerase